MFVLVALVAMAALGPAVSQAAFPANMPGMTYPSNAGGYNLLTLTAAGYADPLNTIRIHLGTPPCAPAGCGAGPLLASTTTDVFGNWAVPITFPAEGQHRLYVYGNNGLVDSVPLVRDVLIDLTAPAAPIILDPVGGEIYPSNTVPLSGTAESRALVVMVDEAGLVRRTTAALDGTWSYLGIFTAGPHTVTAYQNDLAFNQSGTSAPVSFTVDVDTVAPDAPVLTSPAEDSINPASIVITGTAEPLSSVEILEDEPAGFIIYGTVQALADGTFSFPITMLDGLHGIEARATDFAGNVGPRSEELDFLVDAVKPGVVIFRENPYLLIQPFFSGDTLGSAIDNYGVASIEITYKDFLTGDVIESGLATCALCVGTNVRWQYTPDLGIGLYDVEAVAVDQVGNRSPVARTSFLVL